MREKLIYYAHEDESIIMMVSRHDNNPQGYMLINLIIQYITTHTLSK